MAAMESIANMLKGQALDDIGSDVKVQTAPFEPDHQLRPGCYVTPQKKKVADVSPVSQNDVSYGCQITVIRGGGQKASTSPERTVTWDEVATRLFHGKRLDDVDFRAADLCLPCWVEDADPDWNVIKSTGKQVDATAVIVRVWVRETRT